MMEGGTIGAYRIVHKLGQGGMGTVYLGEHTLLERKAAIKVLLPTLSVDPDLVKRFFNEARAVTRISDSGIVQVFDFGVHSDGSAFIVMELLEGEAMDRRLARVGRFGLMECLRLMQQICTSLGAAHAKGVVHRDLKPDNIFLVTDALVDGGERTKILDFGIAKLSGANDLSVLKTQTGTMIGTPVYMSPEQCKGNGEIDHRADIYTIGCLMCTMLTGAPPFEYTSPGELVVAHMTEDAPLVSSRVPELPESIEQIIQKCLEKDADARFQSMAELAHALAVVDDTLSPSTAAATTVGMGAQGYLASGSSISRAFDQALDRAVSQTEPPSRRRWWLGAIGCGAAVVAGITVAALRGGGVAASAQGSAAPPAPIVEPAIKPIVEPAIKPSAEPTVTPAVEPTMAPTPAPTMMPAPDASPAAGSADGSAGAAVPRPPRPPVQNVRGKTPRGGAHGSGSTAGSAAFDRSD